MNYIKKYIAIILTLCMLLLTSCSATEKNDTKPQNNEVNSVSSDEAYEKQELEYIKSNINDLDDPNLLQYVNDSVYSDLELQLADDNKTISVSSAYVSKEYLEDSISNSRENIYYGYSLSELDNMFVDNKYVFTTGPDGDTIVKAASLYSNPYEEDIKNVAIGTGVILVCVTVGGVLTASGAGEVAVFFYASAKTGAEYAISTGAISGLTSGVVEGITTGDLNSAKDAAIRSASEGFKWGAITGVIAGSFEPIIKSYNEIPSPYESEYRALKYFKADDKQIAFKDGEIVPSNTLGSTRPDVIHILSDGKKEAIEVKNYNLKSRKNVSNLKHELKRQISERNANLPEGYVQRIVLDGKGRHYSKRFKKKIIKELKESLKDIYPDIPIEFI